MAIEVRIPDLGGAKDVEVVEILVKPGQDVALDESLIVLSSDKASMDVPSPQAGKIGEIRVKVGGKVSQGDVFVTLEGGSEKKTLGKEKEEKILGKEKAADGSAAATAMPAPAVGARSLGLPRSVNPQRYLNPRAPARGLSHPLR